MAKKSLKGGLFITFEGPEGCGKTTQSKLLFDYLSGRGYDCLRTREPGGTALGERVRKVLLHSDGIKISDIAELFLFEACRAEVVCEVIAPAIKRRKIVICDRFSDATLSYQGYGGGIGLNAIGALDRIATGGLRPDLTVLLDVDVVTGLVRAGHKGVDRMEKKALAYHRRVRNGYLKLAGKYPSRIKVMNALEDIGAIEALVRREVEVVIRRYKRTG